MYVLAQFLCSSCAWNCYLWMCLLPLSLCVCVLLFLFLNCVECGRCCCCMVFVLFLRKWWQWLISATNTKPNELFNVIDYSKYFEMRKSQRERNWARWRKRERKREGAKTSNHKQNNQIERPNSISCIHTFPDKKPQQFTMILFSSCCFTN